MADDKTKPEAATTTPAAPEAGAATQGAAPTVGLGPTQGEIATQNAAKRKFADATDISSPRVLQRFNSYGTKGPMRFDVGMLILKTDVEDYFPSQAAYNTRVHNGFVGIPRRTLGGR